jgi:hypothetical protein
VAKSFVNNTESFYILTAKDLVRYKILLYPPPPPKKHSGSLDDSTHLDAQKAAVDNGKPLRKQTHKNIFFASLPLFGAKSAVFARLIYLNIDGGEKPHKEKLMKNKSLNVGVHAVLPALRFAIFGFKNRGGGASSLSTG